MKSEPFYVLILLLLLLAVAAPAGALPPSCEGVVFEDSNANGRRDAGEPGLVGIRVSDGTRLVESAADGRYRGLGGEPGRTVFVIKPAGYTFAKRGDGLPDFWRNLAPDPAPALKYGGIAAGVPGCRDFALRRQRERADGLQVLVFADPQTKSLVDIDYYRRDIIESVKRDSAIDMSHSFGKFYFGGGAGDLGISLGDIVNDDLSLYPVLNKATASLGVPWLHVAGNHDLDFDATRDEDSLLSFRHVFGPDTFAWEEPEAVFIALDDVIYRPGQKPAYVGGLREDQFAFLQAYLPSVPKERLLVIAVHIPFFDTSRVPQWQTFRPADRERLFALLKDFSHVLLLSGHSHTQQHVYHDSTDGWHGTRPLHEYNVGAACGAFWSGAKDAAGIPDATMFDGTPNGYARLRVKAGGEYALSWHPARDPDTQIGLHAPRVLRQGAYPAWGIYANVYMGRDDSQVEYRVDGGQWRPMSKVEQPDPRMLAENARDDAADTLRGYDRSPEAIPSAHLWRGTLPTDLAAGEHRVEVRVLDPWRGEQRAQTRYRLQTVTP